MKRLTLAGSLLALLVDYFPEIFRATNVDTTFINQLITRDTCSKAYKGAQLRVVCEDDDILANDLINEWECPITSAATGSAESLPAWSATTECVPRFNPGRSGLFGLGSKNSISLTFRSRVFLIAKSSFNETAERSTARPTSTVPGSNKETTTPTTTTTVVKTEPTTTTAINRATTTAAPSRNKDNKKSCTGSACPDPSNLVVVGEWRASSDDDAVELPAASNGRSCLKLCLQSKHDCGFVSFEHETKKCLGFSRQAQPQLTRNAFHSILTLTDKTLVRLEDGVTYSGENLLVGSGRLESVFHPETCRSLCLVLPRCNIAEVGGFDWWLKTSAELQPSARVPGRTTFIA
ncbi:hypothetical protein BV898_04506 [Hypsibius exemplaris]|uniref:Apple domain-containing protein n=1 Tax=Hypsibius exemplaris TaxID=2072580 RepID=A0A1W0X277_HYPEX|nr:hypothetical protein BV898_04506 [Hypsibius exemplaris]